MYQEEKITEVFSEKNAHLSTITKFFLHPAHLLLLLVCSSLLFRKTDTL